MGFVGKNTRAALEEDLAAINAAIDTQKAKVGELDAAFGELNAEYTTAEQAASELAAKQERLAEVKRLLVDSSGGMITAMDLEKDKAWELVAAFDALNDHELNRTRREATANLRNQSAAFAEAWQQRAEYEEEYAAAEERFNEARAAMALGGDESEKLRELSTVYDDLVAKVLEFDESGYGFLDSAEGFEYYNKQLARASELYSELTGESVWFNHLPALEHAFTGMKTPLDDLSDSFNKAQDEMNEFSGKIYEADGAITAYLENLVDSVHNGSLEIESLETELLRAFAGTGNSAELVAFAMEYVQTAVAEAAAQTKAFADGEADAAAEAKNLDDVLGEYTEKLEKLGEAYDKAYNSAYSSMSGQFDLFEQAANLDKKKTKAPTADKMIESLESQAKYIADYSALLEKAKEAGASVDLLASMSDGSEESAAVLEKIGNMGEDKIAELNAAFASVQEGKDVFASTVAQMETDFAASMAAIEKELVDTVAAMDLSDEAAESGRQTMQGLVDGADSMSAAVIAKYREIAQAAMSAMREEFKLASPSKMFKEIGAFTIEGFVIGVEEMAPEIKAVMAEAARLGADAFTAEDVRLANAYASGGNALDTNAISALVTTRSANGDTYIELHVAPTYIISGVSDARGVESALREHDEELKDFILEVLEEAKIDAERTIYK